LDHEPTHLCLLTERAFLRTMEGGCSIPSFALARIADGQITITGGIISLDGQEMIKETMQAPASEPEALGHRLAELVLQKGGDKILESIRQQRN
ncbi:MAG: hydroxymethylbilane synthase, partial [Hymenobacteraceae bacterium]|nr:hydroxymethylbilane synthase [Hymenobacteraceae bacterium]MDX5397641.1 hydroxymethylbilane synthase [Hymenobacteraceae bacterium]MDX5513719.1 hydroxymethylbilane synthase [Hymenobacteraceae bacterium]